MNLFSLFVLPAVFTSPTPVQEQGLPRSTWIDVDQDGLLDLYLTSPGTEDRLMANAGDGTFRDITVEAGLGGQVGSLHASPCDVNGDDLPDLLLVRPDGTLRLFQSVGRRTFADVTRRTGLADVDGVLAAEWIDYDEDGKVDLKVRTRRGDRLFHHGRGGLLHELVSLAPVADTERTPTIETGSRAEESSANAGADRQLPAPPAVESGTSTRSAAGPTGNLPGAPGGETDSLVASCADSIIDHSTGTCGLQGSSVPTLGMLYPLSNDFFIDAATTYVGISNTDPATPLDVNGIIRSRAGGIQFPDGTMQNTATLQGPPGQDGKDGEDGEDGEDGSDALWVVDGTDMYYADGSIGIGTDLPADALHVSGGNVRADRSTATDGVTRSIVLGGTRSGGTYPFAALDFQSFDNNGALQTDYVGARIQAHNSGLTDSGDLRFSTNDSTGIAERVRITEDGDVGIGVTSPTAALDVNGPIRTRSGGLEFPDGTVQLTAATGGIPSGYQILGASSVAPVGYTFSGLHVETPAATQWDSGAGLPAQRFQHGVAEIGGAIYSAGGRKGTSSSALNELRRYDPGTDTWTTLPSMSTARIGLAAVALDGFLYAIGGVDASSSYLRSVERYDPATSTWTTVSPMNLTRADHSAAVLDGKIYVTAGLLGAGNPTSSCEVYDPATNTWSGTPQIPALIYGHRSAAIDGLLYVAGGRLAGGAGSAVLRAFDPALGTWTTKAGMPGIRAHSVGVAMNGRFFMIGGFDNGGNAKANTYVYDPGADSWTHGLSLPSALARSAGAVLGDGVLHVLGGENASGAAVSTNLHFSDHVKRYLHTKD